jgi:spore maturation protein CgeB
MRIFEVLSGRATGGVNSSKIWLHNLYEPLLDLGHEVYLFPAEDGIKARIQRSRSLRGEFSQKLLETFTREHAHKPFDLFFAYLMDGMIDVGVIDEIRKAGVPTCNFSCNNTHQFDLVDEISPHFDYNLHSEKNAGQRFRDIGANPVWFPMAANPKYYHPYDTPRKLEVIFVGQNYAKRPYYIWHLLENGINVHAYGPGWRLKGDGNYRELLRLGKRMKTAFYALFAATLDSKAEWSARLTWLDFAELLRRKYDTHMHPPLSDEAMIRLYSESRISLGFLEVYEEHNPASIVKQHLHLRDFEAPMCGALYLTGFSKELQDFFEFDKEILVYNNEHELLEKIKFYLVHQELGSRIRKAGFRRSLNDHTYHKRFIAIFNAIGISAFKS